MTEALSSVRPKILTVCQGGNVRSVMARYLLNYKYGQDCLACGWEPNSSETKDMLFEWADIIVLMQAEFSEKIPEQHRRKIVVCDIGPDRWGFDRDLLAVTDEALNHSFAFQDMVAQEVVGEAV